MERLLCRSGVACLFGVALAAACGGTETPLPRVEETEGPRLAALPTTFERGMNLEPIGGFGGVFRLDRLPAELEQLRALGVSHVALIPSFFQPRLGETRFTWKGGAEEIAATTRAAIRAAHAAGMAVLLKPHLWLEDRSDGAWRGDIAPDDASWPAWRASYRAALLDYARLAEQEGVAAISIGSELTALALARPGFWRELVADVRALYDGRVTYAANWDREFEAIEWWEATDAIGVDAFWPLLDSADEPVEVARVAERLAAVRERIGEVAERAGRPVLLTEIGYKSALGAAWRPWEWHEGRELPDPGAQAAIYEAIGRTFTPAAEAGWLHGAYFWVWYLDAGWGGPANTDFTPRGKPAADVLAAWFNAPGRVAPRTPGSE